MNSYVPSVILQNFRDSILGEHESETPVPAFTRGIRLLSEKEPVKDGYLYVGQSSTLKALNEDKKLPAFPVCIITSGGCGFFNKTNPCPKSIFLIETSLDLVDLYNQTQDCYHRVVNQKPERSGDLMVNKAFQKIITDILDSRMTDEEEIRNYMKQNSIDPSRYFRVYALMFNSETLTGSIAWNYLISVMQQNFPTSYIASYGSSLVILDRNSHKNPNFHVNKNILLPLLEQYDGFFGVGNVCGHMVSLPAVFSQVSSAIRYGKSIDPKSRIYYYEDYAMYQIVSLCLEAANRNMHTRNPIHLLNNEAVSLLEYDSRHNDDLLSILDSYLLHNCNVKDTSDALFIHRNTLRNKIEKIETIMDHKLGDPLFEERLRFSCSVCRYIKNYLHADPLKLKRNSE